MNIPNEQQSKAEPQAKAAYTVSAKSGMTPFSSPLTLAEAIADSVRARRLGLDGRISSPVETLEATPDDCDTAARLLGWDRDPASPDMDSPINANIVAADLAGGAS